MARNLQVTPGALARTQAKGGIFISAAFLVFGLVFAAVVIPEQVGPEPGLALLMGLFFLVWVGVCATLIVHYARLMSGRGAPSDRSILEVRVEGADGEAPAPDFEARLRKLEALRRDGLITEAEHAAKREEILREKW
jgi:uncharacterized membrane protein YccC